LYELSKLSGQEAKIDQLGQYQEALREEITTCGQRAIERMRIIAAAFPASEIPPIELTNSALHAWRQFIDNVEKLRGRSLILCNNVSPRLMIELLCQRFEKNEEQLEHKKSRHRKEIEAVQAQIDQKRARITQLEKTSRVKRNGGRVRNERFRTTFFKTFNSTTHEIRWPI